MEPKVRIVADSISPEGVRLTSIEVTFHRWVLAEMNTHRTFSRNSASSRAIPVRKQLARIEADPAEPLVWASEQKGMQGGSELEGADLLAAKRMWTAAREHTLSMARGLVDLGLHKSLTNRLVEPHSAHVALITATAWENFFEQRCSPLAQPEIKAVADLMNEAYVENDPQKLIEGEWHLPYIESEDWEALRQRTGLGESMYPEMVKISAARCARVSYLTQEGKRDIEQDLALYDRLTSANPPHWSPLEHVATPWAANRQVTRRDAWMYESACTPLDFVGIDGTRWGVPTVHLPRVGNLLGWRSLRTEVEAQKGVVTYQ